MSVQTGARLAKASCRAGSKLDERGQYCNRIETATTLVLYISSTILPAACGCANAAWAAAACASG